MCVCFWDFSHANRELGGSFVSILVRAFLDERADLANLVQHGSHHGTKSFFGLSKAGVQKKTPSTKLISQKIER